MLQNTDNTGGGFKPFEDFMKSSTLFFEKLGTAFAENANPGKFAEIALLVDDKAISIAKSFGQGKENVLELSRAMSAAVTDVTLLGGNFENIATIQKDIASGLGRNLVLTSDSYKGLFAAQQVLEGTGRTAKDIALAFKDVGFSVYQSSEQIGKVMNVARSMGVNAQAVSEKVLLNMDALNKFNFSGGVEGLAKMAAQATMLRLDMSKTLKLADDLFDPDKAIELAASMQRLGVANSELLDPLRLMDMAQNDPAELQNQITKMSEQFVQLNEKGQFEIMPGAKRQLREIALALGMNADELAKMAIGSKELDMKMQQIKFPDFLSEDQKTMIANMAEMGKDGQFEISIDGKPEKLEDVISKMAGMGEEERAKYLESTQPKTIEELAEKQLNVSESMNAAIQAIATKTPYAIAGTRAAKQALRAPSQLARATAETFDVEATKISNLTKGMDEASNKILTDINKLITGEGSMTQLLTTMGEVEKQFGTFLSTASDQVFVKYEESVKKLGEANNVFIDILLNSGKKITDMFMVDQNINQSQTTTPPLPETSQSNPQMTNMNNTTPPVNNTQQNQPTNNSPIDINLNVTAPPYIDTNQLTSAFQNPIVKEALIAAVNKRDDTSYNSNPQQQIVMANNAAGGTGIPARNT